MQSKPAAEKKRLYEAVRVTRTAFGRWRRGETSPDPAHLALLLHALPQDERERLRALMVDDPAARALCGPPPGVGAMGKRLMCWILGD